MRTRCKAKALENRPMKALLPLLFMPLLVLSASSLPITEFEKLLLEGTLAGMQLLMALSLYRSQTRKK